MPSRVISVCLHIVLDGTVTAPRKTPQCRFNEKGVRNQYPERHPSQRSGLPRVLGMMSGHDRMEGRCRTNEAPSRLALCATGSAGLRPCLRSAGPALCCHAITACCERLRSRCMGSVRSEHGGVRWRGLRPFCGSAKLATVAPWLARKNRSHGMRRAARYSTISTTMWPRPLVLAVDGQSAIGRH